jgi:predicted GIY-YIG superfamily endonuclease
MVRDTTIYCLECADGRYYVGQTPRGRLARRFEEHLYYGGAKWTTRFAPIKIVWKFHVRCELADEAEENAVFEIMLKRGRNSCRGGTFNVGRDVGIRGPRWLKGPYLEHWDAITAAG